MSDNIDLNTLASSKVLEPSALQSYEAGLDLIWKELRRLNSNLFILDKLLKFPSKVILGPQSSFLELVEIALAENSVLVITKLVTDEGEEKGSILRFMNWVREHVEGEYRNAFVHILGQKRGDRKELVNRSRKFRDIRDKVIAHLVVDDNYQLKHSGGLIVSLQELNLICEKLNCLFKVLCFDCEYQLLPPEYDSRDQHPVGVDRRSDIEYFLDLIAKDSAWYKRPESPYWVAERLHLSLEDIRLLNEYRNRFGEPEV